MQKKVKLWSPREIKYLRTRFEDRDGRVVWKSGHYAGRVAGSLDNAGYRVICIQVQGKRRFLKAHRVMWALYNDTIPPVIDHIDRNRDNNRIGNLRPSDAFQNAQNKGKYSNNTTGATGVTYDCSNGRYRARDKQNKHIGYYKTLDEAISARNAALTSTNKERNYV